MAETVIVRQKIDFNTSFLAAGENDPADSPPHPVERIYDLTPYGMLLASIGSCTAVVVNTFARNHGIELDEVEITLGYDRIFEEDCRDCDRTRDYAEEITETLRFVGHISAEERDKLMKVAHYCPIFKIVENGVTVKTGLAGKK